MVFNKVSPFGLVVFRWCYFQGNTTWWCGGVVQGGTALRDTRYKNLNQVKNSFHLNLFQKKANKIKTLFTNHSFLIKLP